MSAMHEELARMRLRETLVSGPRAAALSRSVRPRRELGFHWWRRRSPAEVGQVRLATSAAATVATPVAGQRDAA